MEHGAAFFLKKRVQILKITGMEKQERNPQAEKPMSSSSSYSLTEGILDLPAVSLFLLKFFQ